jgi:hypothetical protein
MTFGLTYASNLSARIDRTGALLADTNIGKNLHEFDQLSFHGEPYFQAFGLSRLYCSRRL